MPSPVDMVEIVLDKPRHLLYTFNAFRKAEMELTKNWGKRVTIPQVLGDLYNGDSQSLMSEKLSITDILIILWAGLVHEEKGLTIDHVGDMVGFTDLTDVLTKIMEALNVGMAKPEESSTDTPLEAK
jgi:hypothetical protein